MTDSAVATITAAALLFCGQVITMIQNVLIGRKTDSIHQLADGNLAAIRGDLAAANVKIEARDAKTASLEALITKLADRKGEVGEQGAVGPVGETGERGQQGPPGTFGVRG